jgi:hypothetical protein
MRYVGGLLDQPSVARQSAAILNCSTSAIAFFGATGVWQGLPKGSLILSTWHRRLACAPCVQNYGGYTTNALVMEIEQ